MKVGNGEALNKKILFCATVDYHFKAFHLPIMKWFKEQGWEVHIAAKGDMDLPFVDQKFAISIARSPLSRNNIKAYRELRDLIDCNAYEIIHCHTPMGGVLARLAARKARKRGTKLLYTAHGFHFCKGAPLAHWLIYYPIEKLLSRYTDCLITINQEDHKLAIVKSFKAKQIAHVHGVGIDLESYRPISYINKSSMRNKQHFKDDQFLLFYAGEFNKNKNQQLLLHMLTNLLPKVPQARLLLAGEGPQLEACRQLAAKLGIAANVHFLGFRNDIKELLPMCDIAVASSLREGLPVNILEAMACGLPVVATPNRGHSELVWDGINGYIVKTAASMAEALEQLYRSASIRQRMGNRSLKLVEQYSLSNVKHELHSLYIPLMSKKMEGLKQSL